MLIIEFDGDSHYCKTQRIKSDVEKDEDYTLLGYRVVRIPYFIQITSQVLKYIFDENIMFKQRYPNGFIDLKATLPADYCELGVKLFKKDLLRFDYHAEEIINSLNDKIKEKRDVELVLPSSLLKIM